ncbi:hypothetical protein FHG87_011923 [Trinorchestia longiramus]|nr:hypothetical protein FHG87_011923 [Trinorchestia longiramus]
MENNDLPPALPPASVSTPSQSYTPSGDPLVAPHSSDNNGHLRDRGGDLPGMRSAGDHSDLRHDTAASKSYLNIGVIPPAFPEQLRHHDHYRTVYSNLHHSLHPSLHSNLHTSLAASGLSSISTSNSSAASNISTTSTICTTNGGNSNTAASAPPPSSSITSLPLSSLSIPSSSPGLHLGSLNPPPGLAGVNGGPVHSFAPVSSIGLPISAISSSSSGLGSAGSSNSSVPLPGSSLSPSSISNFGGLAGLKLEGGGTVGVSDLTINGNERCSSVGAALDHPSAPRGLGMQGLSDLSGIGLSGIGHMGSFGAGLGSHGHVAAPRPASVGALNQLGQPSRLKRNGELYKTKNYVYNRALYEQKMANETPEQRSKRLEYARQRYYRLKHTMTPEELARRNMRAKERYQRQKNYATADELARRNELAKQRYHRIKDTLTPEELARRNQRAKER